MCTQCSNNVSFKYIVTQKDQLLILYFIMQIRIRPVHVMIFQRLSCKDKVSFIKILSCFHTDAINILISITMNQDENNLICT